jgi:hypothetical protein
LVPAPEKEIKMPRHPLIVLLLSVLLLPVACATHTDRHHDTPMPDPAAYAAHFGDLDTDGDDRVSPAEFRAYFPEGDMQVFRVIDADRDGAISHEEWHRFKAAHGLAHP